MAKKREEESSEKVGIFNPHTGQYEAPTDANRHLVDEHFAQAAGDPAPGDRSAEEIMSDEPARAFMGAAVPESSGPVAAGAGEGEPTGVGATQSRAGGREIPTT